MQWWIGTLLGSMVLASVIHLQRTNDLNIRLYLMIAFLNTISTFGYWYGFRNSPSFIFCWTLGFSFNIIFAFVLSTLIYNEPITMKTVIGFVLIIIGIIILKT